jgi:F-type H+/Na+-transporting ATPase subunit alpha
MKKVAGTLRLDLAQYRELAAFAAFGSDLDASTRSQLERGARLVELLKQGQYAPVEVADQVLAIFAATKGYFDKVPVDQIGVVEKEFVEYLRNKHSDVVADLEKTHAINDEAKLVAAIKASSK